MTKLIALAIHFDQLLRDSMGIDQSEPRDPSPPSPAESQFADDRNRCP
ncbi:MAG: hypothetical protein R3C12_21105 [Planctomycetaceae bacterium]